MIIDLKEIDEENFQKKTGVFCGEEAILVTPNHFGAKFTQRNKKFRSSIWSLNGELLSASLAKFVNAGENPENFPLPTSLKKTNAILKVDGSTLIVNKRNGILNCRTRGTFEASGMDNSYELSILQDKYPFAFDNPLLNNEDCSFIFEWVSPENIIVIRYPEPDLLLLNIVKHSNYSYYTQDEVGNIADEYVIPRPESYFFDSLESLINSVEAWEGKEGICLYHSNDQEIHKFKSKKYLYIHFIKSSINTEEKLIDLFLASRTTCYSDFFKYVSDNVDYEVATNFRGNISKICDAYKEVQKILDHMQKFVQSLEGLTRKEQALKINSSYGITNRGQFVFLMLDGKKLENKQLKRLLFQILK